MVKRIKPAVAMIGAGLLVGLPAAAHAASISVNISLPGTGTNVQTGPDANTVDADETAVLGTGLSGAVNVSGLYWNNVLAGQFIKNTQGGSSIQLKDDSGSSNAAQLTSSVSTDGGTPYYASRTNYFADATQTGTTALVQTWMGVGQTQGESITISGLGSEFTSAGYDVILFFETGGTSRKFGFEVTPGSGGASEQLWTNVTAGVTNTPGDTMIWTQATGTTSATATTNANFGVFTNLTADSFTISGLIPSGTGRSILDGFQIVSHSVAVPAPAALPAGLAMLGTMALRRRR